MNFPLYSPIAPGGDRKSTRLNSSHLGISYAVFCLKKKNNYPGRNCDTTRKEIMQCPGKRASSSSDAYGSVSGVQFRFFFFNDTATTEIYTLSLHDALPI